jgi:uncharacterized protein (DUF305 family)
VNAIQKQFGPFAKEIPKSWGVNMTHMSLTDAEGRKRVVMESTDADWLQAVIDHHDTQKSVQLAAQRRLKWVNKAIAGLMANYKKANP